jgi:hypothetical protein
MTDDHQSRAIATIRPLLPPDAEERVKRLVKHANPVVREQIRSETGLRMVDLDGAARAGAPVSVVDGFSPAFAGLVAENPDPVLWALVSGQSRLGRLVDGLNFLLGLWPRLVRWEHLPEHLGDAAPALERTREAADELQKVVIAQKLIEKMKKINEDILGCYRVEHKKSRVEIYWMPIAIVASMLDIPIEDLALVVLAHELAHAYTHLGRDIDGKEWDHRGFFDSDKSVTEGLAQFYAMAVSSKLWQRYPLARSAFDKLLTLQSGPYLAHEDWKELYSGNGSETVRFAMLVARSKGKVSNDEWLAEIVNTTTKLKRKQGSTRDPLFES